MTGTDEVRYIRALRRMFWWLLAAGALVLGAIGALLVTTGQASAQPISVPGIGTIEVPNEVPIPAEIPGTMTAVPGAADPAGIPDTIDAAIPFGTTPDGGISVEPATPSMAPGPEPAVTGIVDGLQAAVPGIDIRSLLAVPGVPNEPAPPAPAAEPEKSRGEVAVEAAESKIGAAYGYGSAGPDAFDCSGLVQWSYGQAGVDVPRTSYEQLSAGTPVGLDELEPGDLVSFYGGGHSAIYAGDGQVIHAGTNSTGVVRTDLSEMPASGARRF
ncbi:NlpC/P60 family protein [Nocardia sp. BMG51109]|uniref:C40 family peptidase n=1 Tax=Nocardia sp. BMG51109 TaxID=1056816 RepID=UPI000464E204